MLGGKCSETEVEGAVDAMRGFKQTEAEEEAEAEADGPTYLRVSLSRGSGSLQQLGAQIRWLISRIGVGVCVESGSWIWS
jgi:hypothetical protein